MTTRTKAKRSGRRAAALKGWETRRNREYYAQVFAAATPALDPNPWPRFAAVIRRWWHAATGWLR